MPECPAVSRAMATPFMVWWRAMDAALVAAGQPGSTWGEAEPLFKAGLAPEEAVARLAADPRRKKLAAVLALLRKALPGWPEGQLLTAARRLVAEAEAGGEPALDAIRSAALAA